MADRSIVKGARDPRSVPIFDLPRDALDRLFTGYPDRGKVLASRLDTISPRQRGRCGVAVGLRPPLSADGQVVDFICGLSPAVSIDLRSRPTCNSTTVCRDHHRGTDYSAAVVCARHALPDPGASAKPPQQNRRSGWPCRRLGFLVLAPGTRKQRSSPTVRCSTPRLLRRAGLCGNSLTDPPKLKKQEVHDIEVVVGQRAAAAHRFGENRA